MSKIRNLVSKVAPIKSALHSTTQELSEESKFQIFAELMKKYDMSLYYKDTLGIFSKRLHGDSFQYMFETKNSCDAIPMMQALDKKLKNLDVCFDVGACIGITAVWLARKSKHVYAFEPEPRNMERLLDNVAANNLDNISASQVAVSDKTGTGKLNILESYGHHSLGMVKTSRFVKKINIKITTIDDVCRKKNIKKIDVLKVDVEGFELEVFKGAERMLKNKKIKWIIFEISNVPLESLGKKPSDIADYLLSFGYNIYNLEGKRFKREDLASIHHADLVARPS